MIIQCEQCKTRFKVGDEKLRAGPIRVRCSKCSHVFQAEPASEAVTAPPGPAPSAPAGVTGLFASVNVSAPPAAAGGGFSSAQNRSGIFRAPTATGMPAFPSQPPAPSADPFAGLAAKPAPGADPFAGLAPKGAPSAPTPAPSDPFAGLAAKGAPSSAGPITSMSMPAFNTASFPPAPPPAPPPHPTSPFAPSFASPALDPFAASASEIRTMPAMPRAATPQAASPAVRTESMSMSELQSMTTKQPFGAAADPFGAKPTMKDPFQAAAQAPVSDPFASLASGLPQAAVDPFAGAAAASPPSPPSTSPPPFAPTTDLFGPGARPATDPFATAEPSNAGVGFSDPFAGITDAPSSSSSVPPPPPSEDADPFAGIEVEADGRAAFDMPTQPPPAAPIAPTMPAATDAPRAAHTATSPPAHAPAGADMQRMRRLEAAQRARALAWGAIQIVIFAAFVVVAVVLGRGGSIDALLRGDLAGALGGASASGALSLSDVHVARRVHRSGVPLVVVTGAVKNTSLESVPGARVDVRFDGDARVASGWAWSDVTGLDVDMIADVPEAAVLSARPPRSSALAPGERAPFVVVGPAPAEGARAIIEVLSVKPPPPPSPVVAPVETPPVAPPGTATKAPAKAPPASTPATATTTTTTTTAKPGVPPPKAAVPPPKPGVPPPKAGGAAPMGALGARPAAKAKPAPAKAPTTP